MTTNSQPLWKPGRSCSEVNAFWVRTAVASCHGSRVSSLHTRAKMRLVAWMTWLVLFLFGTRFSATTTIHDGETYVHLPAFDVWVRGFIPGKRIPDGGTPCIPMACRLLAVTRPVFGGTCRHAHADRFARLRQAYLLPVHPFCSIRRSQGRGVSRQIALHTCQLPKPTVPYPETSAIRSRRPAASAFASESRLRSPGGISGRAGHPARGTLASSRGS